MSKKEVLEAFYDEPAEVVIREYFDRFGWSKSFPLEKVSRARHKVVLRVLRKMRKEYPFMRISYGKCKVAG